MDMLHELCSTTQHSLKLRPTRRTKTKLVAIVIIDGNIFSNEELNSNNYKKQRLI